MRRFPSSAAAAGALVAVLACHPALAQWSDLHGSAHTTGGPYVVDDHQSVSTASLMGIHSTDAVGNDGVAGGSLSVPGGMFTLSAHACSGGRAGFGGQANAGANADVTLDYLVTSATIPAGTPVMIRVAWSVSGMAKGVGQDMVGVNTSGGASLDGQVAIYPNYTIVVNRPGSYSMTDGTYDGFQIIRSGSLSMLGDSDSSTYSVQVGQVLRFFMRGSVGAGSSVESGVIDGDAQLAMTWGLTPVDAGVTLVLSTSPGAPIPPAEMATQQHAIDLRPPRPTGPGILECFRIPGQPTSATACAGDAASFSITVQGQGPFTYVWRKGGVAIDATANPSAATATLMLPGATAADAGWYDCVVTNPCGSIASGAATLAVNAPPVITAQPTPATICGADGAPLSIHAAGAGGAGGGSLGTAAYQWQIQTSPGVWMNLTSDITPLPCGGGGGGGAASIAPENAASVQIHVTPCPGVSQYSVRCVVTNGCGPGATSDPTTVTIGSAPSISTQPAPATACPTGGAPFSVMAAGSTPLSYHWQLRIDSTNWIDLGNDPGPLPCQTGGGFAYASPINSPSVTIGIRPCAGATTGGPPRFQVRCVVSDACGSTTSDEATYSVCTADYNCTGSVSVTDIFDFLAGWFAAAPAADVNRSGTITVQDIFDFLAAWFGGC